MATKKSASLLDLAEKAPTGKSWSVDGRAKRSTFEERLDLVMALIDQDITIDQAFDALASRGYRAKKDSPSTVKNNLAHTLLLAALRGEVKVERVK